jgi:hypothetical protein
MAEGAGLNTGAYDPTGPLMYNRYGARRLHDEAIGCGPMLDCGQCLKNAL